MNSDDWFLFCMGFVFAAGMFGSGCAGCAQEMEQRQAIEAGVGRWVINGKTGVKRFEYGTR